MSARRSHPVVVMRGGFLSIVALVVILALAVLTILQLSTARAMTALSEREALMTTEAYEAEDAAQEALAEIERLVAPVRPQGPSAAMEAIARALEEDESILTALAPEGGELEWNLDRSGQAISLTVTTAHGRRLACHVRLDGRAQIDVVAWKLTTDPQPADDDVLYAGTDER